MLRIFSCFKLSNIQMAKGALLKTVIKEHKYEFQQYEQEPDLLKQIKYLGFELIDEPKSEKVIIQKAFPNSKVIIEFKGTAPPLDAKVQLPQEEQDEDEIEDADDDDKTGDQKDVIQRRISEKGEEYDLERLSVDYTVIIQSPKGEAIAFECNTSNQNTIINYIQPVYDIHEYQKRSKYRKFLTDYPGPEINKLDEQIQQALHDYLESFGINKQMNSFIEAYALDKEQRLYMEFLKSMEKFLSF